MYAGQNIFQLIHKALKAKAKQLCFALFFSCLFLTTPAMASDPLHEMPAIGPVTELPLPRYVSLASAEVNLRTGPGTRYPIKWVFRRHHMPVEIIHEFDVWRKVRDIQGEEGWIHRSMLSGRRYGWIENGTQILHKTATPESAPLARLQSGVIARILACQKDMCHVSAEGFKGWIAKTGFWGVYEHEVWD